MQVNRMPITPLITVCHHCDIPYTVLRLPLHLRAVRSGVVSTGSQSDPYLTLRSCLKLQGSVHEQIALSYKSLAIILAFGSSPRYRMHLNTGVLITSMSPFCVLRAYSPRF